MGEFIGDPLFIHLPIIVSDAPVENSQVSQRSCAMASSQIRLYTSAYA